MNESKSMRLHRALTTAVDILLKETDLAPALSRSLGFVGEAMGADRCYIFRCDSEETGAGRCCLICEWKSGYAGKSNGSTSNKDIPFGDMPDLFDCLHQGRPFRGGGKELSAAIREPLGALSAPSVMVLPIRIPERLWGFVGFDSRSGEQGWDGEEDHALLSYTVSLGSAVERSLYQGELRMAKMAAEAAEDAKSVFIANLSHEIRTPLNAILGFSDLISKRMSDPQIRYYIGAVKTAGENILSLANNIHDLARIEADRLELKPEGVDPEKLLRELETAFAMQFKEKGLAFALHLEGELPKSLFLDAARVRQIISNLLDNACKFTERGQVDVEARMLANEGGGVDLSIAVADTGIGISPDLSKKIFSPLDRMDGIDTYKSGGTGLGLTIARKLASLMGGRIDLASEAGKGSRFTLTLPGVEVLRGGQAPLAQAQAPRRFMPADILLIEDNQLNRMVIQGYLTDSGLQVIEVEDGALGFEFAKSLLPALILLDMHLPGIDGKEILERLRGDPKTSTIPVIVQTAGIVPGDEEAVRSLCDGYLGKPFLRTDLLELLARFLPCFGDSSPEPTGQAGGKGHEDRNPPGSDGRSGGARTGLFGSGQELAAEFMQDWFEISTLESIDDISSFSLRVTQAAMRLGDGSALAWAENLSRACDFLDLPRMEQLFRDFPSLAGHAGAAQP